MCRASGLKCAYRYGGYLEPADAGHLSFSKRKLASVRTFLYLLALPTRALQTRRTDMRTSGPVVPTLRA